MKKLLTLVMALVFALGMFASCGNGADNTPVELKTKTNNVQVKTAENYSDYTLPADFKVGLICLHDNLSTYDKNFIDAMKEAIAELGGTEANLMLKTGIPEGQQCYDTAAELAEAGCKVIFADSFGHQAYMINAAKEFPNVQFCHATGTKGLTENLPNFHNAFASIYEGRYIAGVAAGLKLNEMITSGKITADKAKMGYVGAYPYAEVKSGYTSFYLGAKSVCPSVTMEVSFTNSWYNPEREQTEAERLITNGCVLISQHADSMGAPNVCETKNVPNVFYNGTTIDSCPKTYLISSRINWAPYFKYMMVNTQKGQAFAADWCGTLANGAVEVLPFNPLVAAEGTELKLAEVTAKVMAGTIKIFDTATFTVKGQTLTSYGADVEDAGDYVAETEAVSDGYFHESEYRSAPYFDVLIDGITLLTTDYQGE